MIIGTKNPIGSRLIIEACKLYAYLPSRTLARKLFNENKGVWSSLERCRVSICYRRGRYKRGPIGAENKRYCRDIIASPTPNRPWNPAVYLPKSEEKPWLPHVVSVACDTRALILGDIHLPYHNMAALTAALEHGRKQDCRMVILNGDTLDFHHLSRFNKDPRARRPKEEIVAANQLLDAIDDLFPKALKIWKDGNHDERYDSYIASQAEEIFELVKEHASLPKLLELESRGWEYISEKRPIYLGGLTLIHGHEYPTPVLGPVNAARGLFLRAKESAMVNHHHQTSEHTEPTIREKIITTWSLGCLCELHPMYARFNKWNHGFATVQLAPSGKFQVANHRIHEGRLLN